MRGDEADIRLREDQPDLMILDWMLPGLSGIELCRRLRSRSETERLPVIMLTARGEEQERIRGLANRRRRLCGQAFLDSRAHGPRASHVASGQA